MNGSASLDHLANGREIDYMLRKDMGIPLHVQVADVLRQQIESGELAVDQQIPSERSLCELYGVSRITVRHALGILNQEGLIATVPGKGAYVNPRQIEERLHTLSGFTEDMRSRGFQVSSKILEAQVFKADDEAAMLLQLPKGSEVVLITRLRLTDDFPIALQRSYLPHERCPGILQYDLSVCSLFDVITSEYQLNLMKANMSIKAGLAGAEDGKLLQVESPAPVLVVDQTTFLEDGDIIESTVSTYRGDRFTLLTSC